MMLLALTSFIIRVCIISIVRAIYIGRVSITDGSCMHFLLRLYGPIRLLKFQKQGSIPMEDFGR